VLTTDDGTAVGVIGLTTLLPALALSAWLARVIATELGARWSFQAALPLVIAWPLLVAASAFAWLLLGFTLVGAR
jgi:hypothetical protein